MEKPLRKKIKGILANQVAVLYYWGLYSPLEISQLLVLMLHLVYYVLLTINRNT